MSDGVTVAKGVLMAVGVAVEVGITVALEVVVVVCWAVKVGLMEGDGEAEEDRVLVGMGVVVGVQVLELVVSMVVVIVGVVRGVMVWVAFKRENGVRVVVAVPASKEACKVQVQAQGVSGRSATGWWGTV